MTDEELRERLAHVDPGSRAVDPHTSPRAHELLERTMTHDVLDPKTAHPTGGSRRTVVAGAAAAAVIAAGGVAWLTNTGGTSSAPTKVSTVSLAVQGTPGIRSCIRFDVPLLKQVPTAFAGTVKAVSATSVTLDVTHWYRGGTASRVVLSRPDANAALRFLGVDLAQGKDYLVAAADGVVKGCGYTGEATGDLATAYRQAFG